MQGPLTVQCTVIFVIPNDKIYELPKSWLYCIGIQDLTRIVFAIKSRDNDVAIFFFLYWTIAIPAYDTFLQTNYRRFCGLTHMKEEKNSTSAKCPPGLFGHTTQVAHTQVCDTSENALLNYIKSGNEKIKHWRQLGNDLLHELFRKVESSHIEHRNLFS